MSRFGLATVSRQHLGAYYPCLLCETRVWPSYKSRDASSALASCKILARPPRAAEGPYECISGAAQRLFLSSRPLTSAGKGFRSLKSAGRAPQQDCFPQQPHSCARAAADAR